MKKYFIILSLSAFFSNCTMSDFLVDDGHTSNRPIVHQNNHYYTTKPSNQHGSPYNQSSIVANHTLIQRYTEVDPYTRRTRECGNFKSLRNGAISKYCKNHYGSWDRISGVMMPR